MSKSSSELTYASSDTPSNVKSPTAPISHHIQPNKQNYQKNQHKNPSVRDVVIEYDNDKNVKRKMSHAIQQGLKMEIKCKNEKEENKIEQIKKELIAPEYLPQAHKHIKIIRSDKGLGFSSSDVTSIVNNAKSYFSGLFSAQTKTEEKKRPGKTVHKEEAVHVKTQPQPKTESKTEKKTNDTVVDVNCGTNYTQGEHVFLPVDIQGLNISGNTTATINPSFSSTLVHLTTDKPTKIYHDGEQCSDKRYQVVVDKSDNVTLETGKNGLKSYGYPLVGEINNPTNVTMDIKTPLIIYGNHNKPTTINAKIGDTQPKIDGNFDVQLNMNGSNNRTKNSCEVNIESNSGNIGTVFLYPSNKFSEYSVNYKNEIPSKSSPNSYDLAISKSNHNGIYENIEKFNVNMVANGKNVVGDFPNQSNVNITAQVLGNTAISKFTFNLDKETLPECRTGNIYEPNEHNGGKPSIVLEQNTTINYVDKNGKANFTEEVIDQMQNTFITIGGTPLKKLYNVPTVGNIQSVNGTKLQPNHNISLPMGDVDGNKGNFTWTSKVDPVKNKTAIPEKKMPKIIQDPNDPNSLLLVVPKELQKTLGYKFQLNLTLKGEKCNFTKTIEFETKEGKEGIDWKGFFKVTGITMASLLGALLVGTGIKYAKDKCCKKSYVQQEDDRESKKDHDPKEM